MRVNRRILPTILWLFLTSLHLYAPVNADAPTLLFHQQIDSTPPFAYKTGKGIEGALPDIVRHLVQPLGYQVLIKHTPGARILSEVSAGRGDLLIVVTLKGLDRDAYPSNLLVCPSVIGSVPVRLFSLSKPLAAAPIEEIASSRVGAIRLANFKRSLSREFNLQNFIRFSNGEQVFKALMTERIDVALSDPFTMKSLALIHKRPIPFQSDIDLGELTAYIGLSKKTEAQHDIFKGLCQQAAAWEQQGRFHEFLERHLVPSAIDK
jgi:ABC-type amino acid transport substrate-binding protein